MTDVQRYELSASGPRQVEHGYYVAYSAYARLEAENKRLKGECMDTTLKLLDDQERKLIDREIRKLIEADESERDLWAVLIKQRDEARAELTRLRAEGKHG